MAVVLRFASTVDIMACRWAISPLRETMSAVRMLAQPHRQGYHLPWLRSVAPALERLDLAPLLHVVPRRAYSPDFLAPPPSTPRPQFDDELALVRATDPNQVAEELARCLQLQHGSRPPPTAKILVDDPAEATQLLADVLETCWRHLLLPWWPRIRDVLEGDITYRTHTLANGGLAAVLADLHPKISWQHNTLTIDIDVAAERQVDKTGIVLMPSVFEWPNVGMVLDPPWTPNIDYPARGIAALWQVTAEPSEVLQRLIGRTRAALLAALVEPTSTTGLANRCDLPLSTVSEQLLVLRDAGLITTHRAGRLLRHTRTPLGTALTTPP